MKLTLAHSFWKMYFIGQNLKHVDMTYFFSRTSDLLLTNFSRYLLFGVYFSPHQRNILREYKLHGKPIPK